MSKKMILNNLNKIIITDKEGKIILFLVLIN